MLPEVQGFVPVLYSVLCVAVGYFCGCISTGYLVGKINHVDVRNEGSGNVGATNVLRTTGIKGGLITLSGDILKALLPCLLAKFVLFYGWTGLPNGLFTTDYFVLLIGLSAVLGHNFPFWMNFKGGKGISSTGGVMLVFCLPLAVLLLSVFLVIVALTRYVSLGSVIAVIGIPIGIAFFFPGQWVLILIGAVFSVLAIIRHKANIIRLIHGNENKLGAKKEKAKEETVK